MASQRRASRPSARQYWNVPRRSSSKPLLQPRRKVRPAGTASPSYDHGTVLHKRDFVDSCYMRYGWTLLDLPISCACGNAFNVQHALDRKLGGLRIIQHNEVRDTIAQFMREAGHKAVELEPQLQPLDGEAFDYKSANKDDEARSD